MIFSDIDSSDGFSTNLLERQQRKSWNIFELEIYDRNSNDATEQTFIRLSLSLCFSFCSTALNQNAMTL